MQAPTAECGAPLPHVLRDYALIADGRRGALIGPRGNIAFLCVPNWDSGAVFCSLLGGPGEYVVEPIPRYTWGGWYEDGSLIWRSRWVTTSGIIESREALAVPGDRHTAVVLRRILAVDGDAHVRVGLSVTADFGEHRMVRAGPGGPDAHILRAGPLRARWSGVRDPEYRNGRLEVTLDVPAGTHHDLVLELSERQLPSTAPDPAALWEQTEQTWHREMPRVDGTLADRDARHAYAVLRGLTRRGGGMVAAATTSLPERAEQGRNYDYRYAWIRDQCYAGHAIAAAGPFPLLDDAVTFVAERLLEDGPELEPAYTQEGGRIPRESNLDLPGYPGADVRIGNRVRDQFQLDAFGEALLLFAAADRHDRLDPLHWKAVEIAVDAIGRRWRDPDAGVWELNVAPWAHSRLICAAGLRAVAASASAARAGAWNALADALVSDTTRRCVHRTGRWQRAPDDPRVDAALLLPAIRGAVPAADPRSRRTVSAVRSDLSRDGYVYRFRHDDEPLANAEGAFLLCGFILAMAEHQQGDTVAAARRFERNRAACGSPGLFTEEFDIGQRQLRGNLPQAFVHALCFEAAHRLAQPWPQPKS